MHIRDIVRRVLRPLGFDLVRDHTVLSGHIARLMKALDVNLAIDVGGHWGDYARWLRGLGYDGRILSIEPIAVNYARLEAAMRHDPNWRGVRVAVGAEHGSLPINVATTTDLSSFLRPSTYSRQTGLPLHIERTEMVRVDRLDDVIRAHLDGIETPRIFLKLDTQGYDRMVLQGATEMLGMVVALQAEVAVRPLYEGVPSFHESLAELAALGFVVTQMFPVSYESDRIAAIEYDVVLRRAAVC